MKVHAFLCLLIVVSNLPAYGDGLDLAVQLYQHGQFREAADHLSELSQSSPEDPEVRLWLGKALLKIRKWDDAVHQMEVAVELKPNDAVYYLWLGRACGARASHSSWFTAPGWAKKTLKAFETAQELAPGNLDVRFDLLDYYLHAPEVLGGGRNKAEAEAAAIAGLNPSAGYTARASIFERDKKWGEARDALVQATVLFPRKADAFVDLAGFLLERQDFKDAADYARTALSLDADSAQAKLILAAAHIRLRTELAQAVSVLRSLSQGPLTDEDPAFEEVFYWLGQGYLAEESNQQALAAFSTALRYNPDFDKAKSALSKMR